MDSVKRNTEPPRRHLLRAAGLMGLLTLLSRTLGMIRDVVSARSFGTSWQWDAFIYAFMLPSFLRRLVGEGALSSAFIPVYSEILQKKGKDPALYFAHVVFTVLTTLLLGFLLAVEWLLHLALRHAALPQTLYLMADLLRVFFPYLLLLSMAALGMGVLNCHRHFFTPALGPVIMDLVWIIAVVWIVPHAGALFSDQLRWLAVAVLFSGVMQIAVQLLPLWRVGFHWKWIWDLAHAGLVKTYKLLLPAIMAFAIIQINILVDMTLAFLIGAGANSSLWYGTRLMQFPLGVFAIAMGTALLPTISRQAAGGEMQKANRTLSFAIRSVFLIILPSAIGMMLLAHPIIRLLFERGEFDSVSTARTAATLICYSIGIFAYAGQKLFASGFYAIQDAKTPVKIGVVALVLNIVFNLILMQFLAEAGLALATSISGVVQFVLLGYLYARRFPDFPMAEVIRSFFRILMAAAGMGAVCLLSGHYFMQGFSGSSLVDKLTHVFGPIAVSIAAYVGFCFLFRVREVREAVAWLRDRPKKGNGRVASDTETLEI